MSDTTWPCAELPSGTAIRFALKWQAAGLILMACHVLLAKQSLYLAPLSLLTLGWLYANAPLAGIVVYLQILFFQNCIIGLLADGLDRETFTILQGTNFASICVMAAIAWTRVAIPSWRNLRPLLLVVFAAILIATLYTMVGAAVEGLTSATIYFRSTTAMIFAVIVGLDLGRVYSFRTIALVFITSAMLCMALGYVEFSFPESYYEATNAVQYNVLKTINDPKFDVFYSVQDIMFHNQVVLFNVSGSDSGIVQIRFGGTVMHSISYAYVIAATALVAYSIGYGVICLLLLPLLFLTGVKGANLMFICSMAIWMVWVMTKNRTILTIAALALMTGYIGFGLAFGEENRDYHVLGFLGGVNSLFSTPWGHGIGVGGNLSSTAETGFNWQRFQQEGSSSFALESAVGVLFYQLGVFSVAILAVFVCLLWMAPFRFAAYNKLGSRSGLMFIVLATVAINGVFQEEAYAPTGSGIFTLLCAVIIANGKRPVERISWQRRAIGTKIAHVST